MSDCRACGGEGIFEYMHFVTRDMALDACEPDMEGIPMPEQVECDACEGSGQCLPPELAACPFCGGPAAYADCTGDLWSADCRICCCSTAPYTTKERAAKMWNARDDTPF